MTILWLDTETFSECDLKSAGTHAYAEHPSTEITVCQFALDDDEPAVFDCTGRHFPLGLDRILRDPGTIIVAHNSHFDRTVIRNVWGIDIPVERWRDTMVQALAHGLPGSLDKIGQILGLPADQAKDKRGRELIQLFCKPRPKGHTLRRATRETHPNEWAEFLEYSRQDIVAMRAIHRRLPVWNLREGGGELALWHLDQRINDRGFAVDVGLAESAIAAVATEQARIKAEVSDLTDGAVSSPSKRDELLVHILMEYGVSLPDMRADTLRRRMDDPELPDPVRLLIALRLEATKTSTAKYKALSNATSSDGRLRNTLQFAGALRTARWAGRVFQPQNLPRPSKGFNEAAQDMTIEALKIGAAPLVLDNVMQATANCIRGAIIAPPGRKLCIADLSNIEGRGLAVLAGETWKLKAFAEFDKGIGADLYKLAYARSFNVSPDTVDKDMRQIGKVQELGLGYEGGVAAFITFAAVYNMDLDEMARAVWATASRESLTAAGEMLAWVKKKKRSTFGLSDQTYIACEVLKASWRAAHPATTALWKNVGEAVRNAIQEPGATFTVRDLKIRRDGAWLRIRLPSGRYLCYTQPEVDDKGQISYMGISQYTRQWTRLKSYGGKFCIAAGALVLTGRGWTKIENVTAEDSVWDGEQWVGTAGHICNGTREVVEAHGAWMTPDHLVLTTEGWKDASQSQRHQRAACRLPDGVAVPQQRRAAVPLDGSLRLRRREADAGQRADEAGCSGGNGVVRLQAWRDGERQAQAPRHERTPGLRGVAQHAGAVSSAIASGLGELRRAGDRGVRRLAEFVQRLLGRHGANVQPGFDAGPGEQQRRVLPGQLPLGNARRASQQHPRKPDGERQDRNPACARVGGEAVNDVLPLGGGCAAEPAGRGARRIAQVYDLINCGPRHRFTIWAGGAPLIVHNCENITQAWARDVLAANMPAVEAEGYQIILGVHDELLTETPDTDDFSHERLAALMATPPAWAPGAPLAAAGFECHRYRKE